MNYRHGMETSCGDHIPLDEGNNFQQGLLRLTAGSLGKSDGMSRLDDGKTQRQQKRLSRAAPAISEIRAVDPGNPCSNCSQRPGGDSLYRKANFQEAFESPSPTITEIPEEPKKKAGAHRAGPFLQPIATQPSDLPASTLADS
jgi:hypothetical protein